MTELKNIFEFTEVNDDLTGIRIIEGDYRGLHWTFGTVRFEELEEDGMECKFDYIIHDNPKDLPEDQDMINFMGDILVEVLDQELEDGVNESYSMDEIPRAPSIEMANDLVNTKVIVDHMRENTEDSTDQEKETDDNN